MVNLTDEQKNYLKELYYSPDKASSFSGLANFWRIVSANNTHLLSLPTSREWSLLMAICYWW